MLDCLLLIIPRVAPYGPTIGPALLKAHLQQNGFTAKVIDYNIRLYNDIANTHGKLAHQIWIVEDETFGQLLKYKPLYKNILRPYIKQYVKECVNLNAKWIGLSLLSQRSIYITSSIIEEIKKVNPNQKVVIGGAGAELYKQEFSAGHKSLIIPDQIILGDADEAIVSLLKEEQMSEEYYYLSNLDNLPCPDYSDVTWNDYCAPRKLYITGSRGCVRRCTFCDVKYIWPKYKYRPGRQIAEEMIKLYIEHGKAISFNFERNKNISDSYFGFTDSLINGSLKAFKELCVELKKVNLKLKEQNKKIIWGSQFICRSAKQMPEDVWAIMPDAGCKYISIGIESGSESVRDHMGKKFTNEDMYYTFDMATKYGVIISFNIIVGYPTETEKDFNDTLTLLKVVSDINETIPNKRYRHNIGGLNWCNIIDNTDLQAPAMGKELGIILNNDEGEYRGAGADNLGGWGLKDKGAAAAHVRGASMRGADAAIEGLPYNKIIRMRRLITTIKFIEGLTLNDRWVSHLARLPQLYEEYKKLTITQHDFLPLTNEDFIIPTSLPRPGNEGMTSR